jgi:Uma2 family endonuclease
VLPLTPADGWTLDNLPANLPKHTELIRGVLVMSPQTTWHLRAVDMLAGPLEEQCPGQLTVLRSMAIRRSPRTAPEPDISIVRASAVDADTEVCDPEDVCLAVEVVSAESAERDREDKPALYAAMGIPAFWLVERDRGNALIVHEHRLIGGGYHRMRTAAGRFATDTPFPVDIPLGAPCARGRYEKSAVRLTYP